MLWCFLRVWPYAVFLLVTATDSPGKGYAATPPPELLLAKVYAQGIDLDRYWVSEKLDGVRAYWDGTRLISRRGNVMHAPEWFIQDFPNLALDGELWMGRNSHERLSGAVRRQRPIDQEWRKIRFMVFDLPNSTEIFDRRLQRLRAMQRESASPYWQLVEQFRVPDHQQLMERLEAVARQGGEGLMLHRGDSLYRSGRSNDLLKLKPYLDAEATVIEHLPGKGRFAGMMGALLVEMDNGKRFRIGTGFSDSERRNPPPIGSVITYKYHGLTNNGVPRFASFLRVRKAH